MATLVMPLLQALIETCCGKGIPIIYTTGTQRADKWDAGSWAWKSSRRKQDAASAAPLLTSHGLDGNEIAAEIAPRPHDIVIHRQKHSGFAGTPLTSYLQLLGCDSVVVTGTTTSGCVRATVLDTSATCPAKVFSPSGCVFLLFASVMRKGLSGGLMSAIEACRTAALGGHVEAC